MPLSVDAAGLRQGAGSSVALASDLAGRGDQGSDVGSQPSHAGVAALNGAVVSVRRRQAQRVKAVAADMLTSADAYDTADADARGRLAESM
ncbi:hypothetical protein TUM20985_28100 [Mycobacterium antarcticum]|nr:hypothetical protein TUM20985_28100 [Mycolicibacterium sp. TUM20985]